MFCSSPFPAMGIALPGNCLWPFFDCFGKSKVALPSLVDLQIHFLDQSSESL